MFAGSPGVWYGAAKTGPEWSGSPATDRVSVERMTFVASRIDFQEIGFGAEPVDGSRVSVTSSSVPSFSQ